MRDIHANYNKSETVLEKKQSLLVKAMEPDGITNFT